MLNGFYAYLPLSADVVGGIGDQMCRCVVSRSQKHHVSPLFSFG
jgi:hypothetical protein